MKEKLRRKLQLAALVSAFALMGGLVSPNPIAAQQEAATEVAETATEVTGDDDEGFDDWGLLGLAGLLGLGGLLRRNEPEVRRVEPVDRVDTTIR